MSEQRIAIAAIAGAHGIKGEVRLKLLGDSAEALAAYDRLFVGGVERRLVRLHTGGKAVVALFDGVTDRSAAEALRGSLVEIDREALSPLDEGEFYYADLIGLPCVDADGAPRGTVVGVENFGAGDLLEIEADGRRWLISFKPGVADLADGRLLIDPDFLA